MLKLCEQNIKNLLPCEPFKVKESKIIGKDLHLYFEFNGQHEICPEYGEPFQIHQWREIVLLLGNNHHGEQEPDNKITVILPADNIVSIKKLIITS